MCVCIIFILSALKDYYIYMLFLINLLEKGLSVRCAWDAPFSEKLVEKFALQVGQIVQYYNINDS